MLYADGLRGDRPSLYPTNEKELEDCNALCEKLHNVLGIKMRVVVYGALLKYEGWMDGPGAGSDLSFKTSAAC
jgi:hypothetical protein